MTGGEADERLLTIRLRLGIAQRRATVRLRDRVAQSGGNRLGAVRIECAIDLVGQPTLNPFQRRCKSLGQREELLFHDLHPTSGAHRP